MLTDVLTTPHISLRLLATTDIHAHLLPHDYVKDCPAPGIGLAGIATLIDIARAEAAREGISTLLLDNGDLLQGTPLADYLAQVPVNADHPIVASLNHLDYDAVGLGNHDFDHGVKYLNQVADALKMPVVCTNLSGDDVCAILPSTVIPCKLPSGEVLQVGILSVVPPLTAVWNRQNLGPKNRIASVQKTLETAIPKLRQQGADIIVVLAHMGVGQPDDLEASAVGLAQIPGVDALITGHTHRRLPGPEYIGRTGVDAQTGLLESVPAIMAGHSGSDLAVMDLELAPTPAGGWTVLSHTSALRPNLQQTPQDSTIGQIVRPAHNRVRRQLAQKVGTLERAMHSCFALVTPAPTSGLIAAAKMRLMQRELAGTEYSDLPLLCSAAAHASGGRGGPEHFLHLPAGPVLRRHIAGLSPFANQLVAVRANGAKLRAWLEHSARIFAQLSPNAPNQALIDAAVPGFHFDTIFGLEYLIDPTARLGHRIRDLSHNGRPLRDDQHFALVTNQFRAAGGGSYAPTPDHDVLARSTIPLPEALIARLMDRDIKILPEQPPWQFAPLGGAQAVFYTSHLATEHLDDIAHLSPQVIGHTDTGFVELRVTL
ncbi:bifunctional metallophosphatase/5'-nucleotidase [Sulfitobacter sp. SK012]|nr:bifunctional metallophosphatase/5'-nucleotidase [Sulfitobacter sp. SK012]